MSFPHALACAALAIAGLTQPTTAEQIGPSFDCAAARQPLAQILCANPDLSRTDLLFAQAYFALLPQLDDAGKRELKQEDLRFLDAAQQHCGIPPTGPIPAQSDATRKCVKDAYESQRSVWLLRLRPPFSEEASRPIERHIALQRFLQQIGFLAADAAVDGVYGAATRDGISRWQSAHSRSVTGVLGDSDAQALEGEASQRGAPVAAATISDARLEAIARNNSQKPSAIADSSTRSVNKLDTTETRSSVGAQATSPQETRVAETTPPPGATAAALSEGDAKRIADEVMNGGAYQILLLGNIIVYGGPFGLQTQVPNGNNISAEQYDRYKAWTQTGVIKIASQGPLSQQGFSDNNWMALGQGVQERITVTATCTGNEICQVRGNTLKVRMGTFKTDNVIKNDERILGVHTYRILMGTYLSDWTPAYRSFSRISKQSLTDKGKFIILLKYDEFTQRWGAITADYASIDQDFTTHNVDQQMRTAQ